MVKHQNTSSLESYWYGKSKTIFMIIEKSFLLPLKKTLNAGNWNVFRPLTIAEKNIALADIGLLGMLYGQMLQTLSLEEQYFKLAYIPSFSGYGQIHLQTLLTPTCSTSLTKCQQSVNISIVHQMQDFTMATVICWQLLQGWLWTLIKNWKKHKKKVESA